MGTHGACPSEKLHAILLGILEYTRDIFFVYCGKSSQLAEDMNGLGRTYAKLFTRQSERNLPNTSFSKGIQEGKFMATQYRGIMLVLAAILRSSKGRDLPRKKKRFKQEERLEDWLTLVEMLLEWEAHLCLKQMKKEHVKKLGRKHRYIMCMMKNVAERSAGMGLKIMKFHAITHIFEDMLLHGVPAETDTGSNESHHKPTKAAAKMTQRKESTFDLQTATRLTEFLAIDLAMVEVLEDFGVWDYFNRAPDDMELDDLGADLADMSMEKGNDSTASPEEHSNPHPHLSDSDSERKESPSLDNETQSLDADGEGTSVRTGGTKIRVFEDEDNDNQLTTKILGKSKWKDKTRMMLEVVQFLGDLQQLVAPHWQEEYLPIFTEHTRGDTTFRGHPNYRGGGPWRDWVLVDWGDCGTLPSKMWCFVDLSTLNPPPGLQFGGVHLQNSVCAVVETADYDHNETEIVKSDIFVPLKLTTMGIDKDGDVEGRMFFLAIVDAFVGPCCVIPDIGGETNSYFQVKSMQEWSKEFIDWTKAPHKDDEMWYSDEET